MLITPDNFKQEFEKIIKEYDEFAIVPHYNPDPDALGSSYGMYYLLNKVFKKKARIYFSGIIGRAENNKMIQLLDIPVKNNNDIPDLPIILMDTQPGTGNNPLHSIRKLKLVFDHHPIQEETERVSYADIRLNYGACSTIVYDYFKAYNIKPIVNVATALFYGIQTDVVGEGRTAYKIDFEYMEELSANINREKLYSIENPKLPFDYYIHINKGMENSVIYNDFLITSLGEIENPDYIGEIADFLIRFDKAFLVLVMGVYKDIIQLSFRSQKKKVNAGMVLKEIVGKLGNAGGHFASAGGRILIQDTNDVPKINKKIITKSLNLIQGKITSGVPFLSLGDYLNY
ncbi:MAG: DHH family phosphoesterase [Spirochaetes bacterium]|nr:DHH family phosphoesterase [Spirochaetota bacterium]